MPNIVLSILKYLALKYAAKLILDAVIDAASKGAAKTDSKLDDEIVQILKDEKDFLVSTINGALK